MNNTWIYDLETFKYMFLGVFFNVKTKKYVTFEISNRKNQIKELRNFLNSKKLKLIGYNNINFDYPVLHKTVLKNNENWTSEEIYKIANSLIGENYTAIPYWKIKIPQLDLFKIWHYDNAARRTSLKWLEYAMRMKSIEDLPYKPDEILSDKQMNKIISYCYHDIDATYKFYLKSLDKIKFRVQASKDLKQNVMNYSDVKIGETLNKQIYSKLSGRKWKEFKNLRTHRNKFEIKELIPDYIKFESDYLNDFLNGIKNKSFDIKEKFTRHLKFAEKEFIFAKGGLHSVDTPIDIKCGEDEILQEKDVGLNWLN